MVGISLTDILEGRLWMAAVALAASLVATPIVRHIAYRRKLVDRPDHLLKPHGRPVAYLGGVALYFGILVGLGTALLTRPSQWNALLQIVPTLSEGRFGDLAGNPAWNLLSIALACTVITAVGVVDDLREIKPKQKVLGQVLAATILLIGGVGLRIGLVFLGPLGLGDAEWLVLPFSAVMCMVLVVAICNASNLLDGLDGLCSGVIGIVALGFLALSIWLAMWGSFPEGLDELRVVLCLVVAGAIFGFLPYNAPPASIFMGDAGSMLLGFLVATMMMLFCQEGTARWFLASLVVFSVPILDTALAVVRRLAGRTSIFAGDRSHLYDQLVDRGMSVKQVVGLLYGLSVLAAIVGVAVGVFLRLRYALPLYGALFTAVWILFHRLRMTRPASEPSPGTFSVGTKKDLRVLFTSVGRRVSLLQAFQRAASDLHIKLHVHAVDCKPLAPALQVADRVGLVPPIIGNGGYCEALLAYCREHEIDALIPLIDPELEPLALRREQFAEVGTQVILSSPGVVSIARDKIRTRDFLVANGFRTPRIYEEAELATVTFPVFLKLRDGSASLMARRIDTRECLAFRRKHTPGYIVQEFIEGVEYTVDVFADFDGRPRCAVPRRRHEVRAGEVSKSQAVREERIIDESCRIVEALGGCKGMITTQCFLTPADEIVHIEINPRFGGGVPLSIRAGADSPRWLLELLLGREPAIDKDAWIDRMLMLRYDEAVFATPNDLPT